MVKGIIFDLDGTLLDTLPDIMITLNRVLEKFGYSELSREKCRDYIGNGARKLVERALPAGAPFDEPFEKYAKLYALNDGEHTEYFDGVLTFLKSAVSRGVKLAIITNKPQRVLDKTCAKFFADIPFVEKIGQSDNTPLKPDPTSTLGVIKLMGLKNSECLFIGDGETDVETARRAGVECISVLWGYRSKESLKNAGANKFVNSYKELENLIFG